VTKTASKSALTKDSCIKAAIVVAVWAVGHRPIVLKPAIPFLPVANTSVSRHFVAGRCIVVSYDIFLVMIGTLLNASRTSANCLDAK
jgi:hypothetical protein